MLPQSTAQPRRTPSRYVTRREEPAPSHSGNLTAAGVLGLIDTLAVMERRGPITTGMRQAGRDFRALFARPTRSVACPDLSRPREIAAQSRGWAGRAHRGRSRGSLARDPGGRWSRLARGLVPRGVVGWGQSLKEWALERGWSGRRVSQEAASGIWIAALGVFEIRFGERTCYNSIL
jgi:hypothetical protein